MTNGTKLDTTKNIVTDAMMALLENDGMSTS